tara:strand:+ start:9625 stop:9966 length:342 start_codon:yes stop_codon:yes gene_type:complete
MKRSGQPKEVQGSLFKMRKPPPKKKKKPTAKQLIGNARGVAFEISAAAKTHPELDQQFREQVHASHLFINTLKQGKATARDAVALLGASRKLIRLIKRMEADEKSGQQRFKFE